jgi:anti-sigma regulatory factor (Ser/Thr protein kinase)
LLSDSPVNHAVPAGVSSDGVDGVTVLEWDGQLEVAPEPSEVGRARRWARTHLGCPDGAQADTVALLVSELVTNAVVHTGRPAVLRLRRGRAGSGAVPVRLEVVDGSGRAPVPRRAAGEDTAGRGLELVEILADRWGWQAEGAGKRVWCELDFPALAPAREAPERSHEGRKVPASS